VDCRLQGAVPNPIKRPRIGIGCDGSQRKPDGACTLTSQEPLNVAIEYKLYRDRKSGAGELDRGLGQCVAYAERHDAILLFVVFMSKPRDPIPRHWLDRSQPLLVGHGQRRVPVYFAARPRKSGESWRMSSPGRDLMVGPADRVRWMTSGSAVLAAVGG
jgi:hypothetical protein